MVPMTTSDADLLTTFSGGGATLEREAAFAELLRRHGPMVLATCRRILGPGADAEDAAQAVFLVLADKAKTLTDHPTLGGWLHRTARHVAARQRDAGRVRRRHEEASAMIVPEEPLDERRRTELREELDGALDRLSERYRVPLVLHYLEGHPQEEVARLLNLNPGTLASLLSRGREQLREVLGRRGVAVGALALAGLLAAEAQAAAAPVPLAFAAATAHAAAAGVAPPAAALTAATAASGGLTTMAMLKLGGLAVLAAGALVTGSLTIAPALAPAGEVAPAPVVVAVPPVAPTPAAPSAEAAVTELITALRGNDATGLLARLAPAQRSELQQSWKRFAGQNNPFRDGVIERLLALGNGGPEADRHFQQIFSLFIGGDGLAAALQALAAKPGAPTEAEPRRTGFLIPNLLAGVVGDILASGLENEQTKAIADLLDGFATWSKGAGLDDADKQAKATAQFATLIKGLGIGTAAELGGISVDDAAGRLGKSLGGLKVLLALYDLQLDQVLDSAKVGAARPVPGEDDARFVTVAFTAFGKSEALPLKLVRHEDHWQIAGDSPLVGWLRPRFGGRGFPGMWGGGGQPRDGRRGGRPGGPGDAPNGQPGGPPGAPAQGGDVPKPAENPGF